MPPSIRPVIGVQTYTPMQLVHAKLDIDKFETIADELHTTVLEVKPIIILFLFPIIESNALIFASASAWTWQYYLKFFFL